MGETKIRLTGQIAGRFWMPCARGWKDFSMTCSRGKAGPFEKEIGTLRDAMLDITNDGDFQDGEIINMTIEVIKTNGNKRTSRWVEYQGKDENKDLISEDYPEYFGMEDYE